MSPKSTKQDGGAASESPELLNAFEALRAASVAADLARTAATDESVREVRAEVLGGETTTVTPSEAAMLLASPAARVFSAEELAGRGIPVVGHQSRLDTAVHGGELLGERWEIGWPGGRWSEAVAVMADPPDAVEAPFLDDAGPALVPTLPGSVVGRLVSVAASLAERLPWSAAQALHFLLTGTVPEVPPVEVSVEPREAGLPPRIVVRADPWVSAETVARAVRDAQRGLAGGINRPLGERALAVHRFVGEARAVEPRITWRRLHDAWAVAHPEWRYADVRNFATDWRRAERALFPGRQDESTSPDATDPQQPTEEIE